MDSPHTGLLRLCSQAYRLAWNPAPEHRIGKEGIVTRNIQYKIWRFWFAKLLILLPVLWRRFRLRISPEHVKERGKRGPLATAKWTLHLTQERLGLDLL